MGQIVLMGSCPSTWWVADGDASFEFVGFGAVASRSRRGHRVTKYTPISRAGMSSVIQCVVGISWYESAMGGEISRVHHPMTQIMIARQITEMPMPLRSNRKKDLEFCEVQYRLARSARQPTAPKVHSPTNHIDVDWIWSKRFDESIGTWARMEAGLFKPSSMLLQLIRTSVAISPLEMMVIASKHRHSRLTRERVAMDLR